jgi:hypothetical protein
MMKEGYWLNYRTDKAFPITDHEVFIRDPKNAKKLGVPQNVITLGNNIKNREKFLLFLMNNAPIIRVRGHGSDVTFEFATKDRSNAMDAIWLWGKQNAGPFTFMSIRNYATKENVGMVFSDFDKQMKEGGPQAVLLTAKTIRMAKGIVAEILAISKQLVQP